MIFLGGGLAVGTILMIGKFSSLTIFTIQSLRFNTYL